MILKEEYYKGHPEIPNSIDDATPVAQFLPYSSHFEGRSDIANTIADPQVGMFDMGFKNMFSEGGVKPKNYDEYVKQIVKATKALVDVREYAELVVSLPNVRKNTTVLPKNKNERIPYLKKEIKNTLEKLPNE